MMALPGRDAYDWWMLAAQWFSAVGTVGAVIVALFLAQHQNRVRLRVICNVSHVFSPVPGTKISESPQVIRVSATNVGHRDAVVDAITWEVGWLKRRRFYQMPTQHAAYKHPLPSRLAPGEEVTVLLDKVEWVAQNGNELADAIRQKRLSVLGSRFRVVIHTSTGERFSIRPDDAVLKEFAEPFGKTPVAVKER